MISRRLRDKKENKKYGKDRQAEKAVTIQKQHSKTYRAIRQGCHDHVQTSSAQFRAAGHHGKNLFLKTLLKARTSTVRNLFHVTFMA